MLFRSGFIKINDLSSINCNSTVNGSGNAIILTANIQNNLRASLNSSGSFVVKELTAQQADISANGSGQMILTGKVQKASISLNSSAVLNCRKLEVADLNIDSSGSGTIFCWATNTLTTNLNSKSRVVFDGNPKSIINWGKYKVQEL